MHDALDFLPSYGSVDFLDVAKAQEIDAMVAGTWECQNLVEESWVHLLSFPCDVDTSQRCDLSFSISVPRSIACY